MDQQTNNNTILDVPVNGPGGPEAGGKVESTDPTEESAFFVNQAHNQFKTLAYGLANKKKRALARVLEAVLFEPLEKVELVGEPEKELFAICQQIMYHKGVVLRYAFERMEKIKKGEVPNEHKEE
jgi:hypothetical protein